MRSFPLLILLASAGLVACAGAEVQDVLHPLPEASAQSGGVTKGKADPSSTSNDEGSTATKTAGPSGTKDPSNSGEPSGKDNPGNSGGCAAEVESNDSVDEASPFTSCVSG